MIEIYHYKNRFGKQCVAVFAEIRERQINLPDFVKEYHVGIDPPDFHLPVPLRYTEVFTTMYALLLLMELLSWRPAICEGCPDPMNCGSWMYCERGSQ